MRLACLQADGRRIDELRALTMEVGLGGHGRPLLSVPLLSFIEEEGLYTMGCVFLLFLELGFCCLLGRTPFFSFSSIFRRENGIIWQI